ncbi:sugar ABC transporter substrate-binding protein [Melioribacteraceae bacterium 4301-Me]|uniref:sugar ABC transporter substrate-binding protein n=1 Tax=Pyranulibacter aquaticus TaxID=3163344 RepID=UPI0035997616
MKSILIYQNSYHARITTFPFGKVKVRASSFLICIFLLWSCSQTENKIVTLNFWAMGVEGEVVSKLIPDFEKEFPNIKIKVQQIPWTAAHEKLITAFASETLPDVFQLGNTWIPEFKALNAIAPLNNFINHSSVVSANKYFEGIWDTNVIDSIIYGIPWYVDTRVLFYRKDILESVGYKDPPKTWNELFEMSVKIRDKFKGQTKYAMLIPTNEWVPFIIFGIQNGSSLLKDNDEYADFSGKKFKDAFDFLIKFYRERLAPTDMQQVLNIYQAFAEGFFTFYITGPWNVTEMKKRLPISLQDSWMTAPLPSPDSNYPGYSLAGGSSLVLNKNSKNKIYAWKWIEYLSKNETQLQFYKLVSSLPAVKKVWEDSTFANDPYMRAFYIQLHKTKATPKIPEWEQIVFSKIQQYAEAVATNKMNSRQALNLLDEDANKILEKRRWILSKER